MKIYIQLDVKLIKANVLKGNKFFELILYLLFTEKITTKDIYDFNTFTLFFPIKLNFILSIQVIKLYFLNLISDCLLQKWRSVDGKPNNDQTLTAKNGSCRIFRFSFRSNMKNLK